RAGRGGRVGARRGAGGKGRRGRGGAGMGGGGWRGRSSGGSGWGGGPSRGGGLVGGTGGGGKGGGRGRGDGAVWVPRLLDRSDQRPVGSCSRNLASGQGAGDFGRDIDGTTTTALPGARPHRRRRHGGGVPRRERWARGLQEDR